MNKRTFINLLFSIAIFACSISYAQTKPTEVKEEDPDKGLPKSGVLSSTYTDSTGAQSKSASLPWNKKGAGESDAPLGGSISRTSQKQWKVTISNNTEDEFNASVVLKQLGSRGDSVKSDSFSLRLKPKSTAERFAAAIPNALDAELELSSWKRIVKAKPTETPVQEQIPVVQIPTKPVIDTSDEISNSTSETKTKSKLRE